MAVTNISGISESRVAPVAAEISYKKDQNIIIVASDQRAKRLASDLSFFAPDKDIIVLSSQDGFFTRYEARSNTEMMNHLKALKALRTNEPVIIILPVTTAIKKIVPRKYFEKDSLKLEFGKEYKFDDVKEKLYSLGYERIEQVEVRGEFSIRGGIIDVFTPDSDDPYRIEFFGDEVDSIRLFDIDTQRSKENLKYIEIYPANEITGSKELFKKAAKNVEEEYSKYIEKISKKIDASSSLLENLTKTKDTLIEYITEVENIQLMENYLHYFYEEIEHIWDYMNDGNIMIDDPDRIYEMLDIRGSEQENDFEIMLERGQVIPKDRESLSTEKDFIEVLSKPNVTIFTPFAKKIKHIDTFDKIYNMQSRQTLSFEGKLNVLETELKSFAKRGYDITLVFSSPDRMENLKEFVDRIGLADKVKFALGSLSQGIDFPTEKRCWISENDIFNSHKKIRKKTKRTDGAKLKSFSDLNEGDFVVHENHGIGKFIGIEQLRIEGVIKDYFKIKYGGNDMLYVPVEQMDMVQKYIGGDGVVPKINKLSGGDWKLTVQKAKTAVLMMAKDLVDLYAKREIEPGYAFSEDTVWQKEFEDAFPFEETDDQLRAIEEIKEDMSKPYAMDRLLLGDVGYGKTEVAARAMFKCVSDGKQAALLVPTTILANQHFFTLKDRFEKFPFKVEVLSRFKSASQQKDIIDRLSKGQVDLIIGTHRLLSNDVKFKDLGLLVVDEEQRFGVEDKENLRKLKASVDLLTLSATPIPRTLNMSLTGIKNMSLIEEPPLERYPVQTYVMEEADQLIKEIVERELGRSGQVFVVFNRVKGINQVARKIEELVPEARVAVGHGQMNERQLEDVMLSFIEGDTNVLVATTIVESGLDIQNANSMIILDADKYGLSQLYQLRGRVGRSNRMAYCYLMYKKDKVLNEAAEKRLKAIKDFTEFGAGFKIAMKDLEIRGAGNLLGTAQHGHMMNVGYEMYCKMVDNAVRALRGEIVVDSREECTIDIPMSAYIPEWYIEDEIVKLQMYKKIAEVRTKEDEDEILDELLDRFGDVPKETIVLIKVSRIKHLAEDLKLTKLKVEEGRDLDEMIAGLELMLSNTKKM